ncbi:phosphatidate cytidylyltransferase [Peptoniphilus stercorisuis]|uniref:Phosphatidate cytidylyltransferase n=1 Tax=Peptoniphilus stercorisuis TaxID=1436965 RepID=A0ABS4KE79_9FIRM|nr:phosphatidate cytidylyltransferase [Peptoniphilus stercorisuis]MBP2025486.1 phosphatidate cytidylyltransferase [Peptoniphilus stercorisuis]
MTELQKRVLTGIVGIVVLLFVLMQGGIFLKLALFLLSVEVVRELYNAFRNIKINLNIISLLIGCISLFIFEIYEVSLDFSIILVLISSFIFVLFSEKYSLNDIAFTVFSFIYGPYLLNLLYGLDKSLIYLVFIIAFSTDTFAYFIGSAIGKHKLIPKVSPNKSIEGALGGIIGCLVLTLIYFYYIKLPINILSIIFIIIASMAGQIGDLFASKIKRITGIKDYAKILPGHGGILDRFDSTILIIPFIYILQFFLF